MCASIGLMLDHRLIVDRESMQQRANVMVRLSSRAKSCVPVLLLVEQDHVPTSHIIYLTLLKRHIQQLHVTVHIYCAYRC